MARIGRSLLLSAACLVGVVGCAASTAEQPKKTTPAPTTPPKPAQTATSVQPEPIAPLPALADEVAAGNIPRSTLLDVLAGGAGRFLQHVRVQRYPERGRFVGWRILTLFEKNKDLQAGVLQPGDTILRVNGQSIERPEQFQNVWESLATESELLLSIDRAGKQSLLHYPIVDDALPVYLHEKEPSKRRRAQSPP